MLKSLLNRTSFPETRSVLNKLGQSFRIYICSNTDTLPLLQNIQYNGLFVHDIFTSEKLNCYKPDPRSYQSILYQTGLKAEEAVFIGDSYLDDIKGPKKLGIYSVLIDRKQSHMAFGGIKPDRILTSLPDLYTVASWFQPAAVD
jgi:putative hydrolase of the HAD superfamily